MTFRNFAVKYGAIKEFPTESKEFQDFVDSAFITIHENFVDGKLSILIFYRIKISEISYNDVVNAYLFTAVLFVFSKSKSSS